jgi:hypothetical protein
MSLDKLRADWEKAEARAHKLTAQKDEIRDKLRAATEDAARAQKTLNDAEAAQALADREDLTDDAKAATADRLGLTLPG